MLRIWTFSIGMGLFLINIWGLFLPLRNEQLYFEKNVGFERDIVLSEQQLWEIIDTEGSDVATYLRSLNAAVNAGIAHYWRDEGIDKYSLRVPWYENYFLYLASWVYPPVFQKYEFSHYRKAIERGVGLCSQQSIIVSEILKEKGIASKIVKLGGHVVAMAQVEKGEDKWWILDADYGVLIPHAMSEIEKDPTIIGSFYEQAGYDSNLVSKLINIYGATENTIINGVKEYDSRAKSYALRYYLESFTYLMKWLLPFLLLMPYVLKISGKMAVKSYTGVR